MKKILSVLAVFMLSACGFHLKGSPGLMHALPYQNWQIVNGGALQQPLVTALKRADGQIATKAADAQADIVITRIDTNRDIYTITRAADVNEYLLTLRVEAHASIKGEQVGEPMVIVVQRTMDYWDSEVLGKGEEEETVGKEMREDAAEQIVRRLTFLKAK